MGRRIGEIAYAVLDIQGGGSNGLAIYTAKIERPSGLAQPRRDIGLELGVILFGGPIPQHKPRDSLPSTASQ